MRRERSDVTSAATSTPGPMRVASRANTCKPHEQVMPAFIGSTHRPLAETITAHHQGTLRELPLGETRSGASLYYMLGDDNAATSALHHFRTHHQAGVSWGVMRPEQVKFKLAFFDMDGTLVAQETAVELARHFLSKPLQDEVTRITSQSMAGEISFVDNLVTKMRLFKDTSATGLATVTAACSLNPGAKEFVSALHQQGVLTYIVTGGLTTMAAAYAKKLNMEGFCANTPRWTNRSNDPHNPDWVMSGELEPPIVDGAAKARYIHSICTKQSLSPAECLVVGDGANDIAMAKQAGLAVGFQPKPALAAHVHVANEAADHRLTLDMITAAQQLFAELSVPARDS